MKVSKRRASLGASHCATSKLLTSPAIRVGKVLASKRVIGPMPDLPATMFDQAVATPIPTGEMMPRPVMTALRLAKGIPCAGTGDLLEVGLDVFGSLLHGGDFLGLLVRNFAFEFLFQRHHEFDRVERVRAEVIHER